jgi:hypothetical protein
LLHNRAVTILLQCATQQEVATALVVHQTTVHRLHGRLVQFGNTNDRPRSVRPRVTTARQDRLMRLAHLCNRTRTAVETAITTPGTHKSSEGCCSIPEVMPAQVPVLKMADYHVV